MLRIGPATAVAAGKAPMSRADDPDATAPKGAIVLPDRAMPYPVSRLAPRFDLVDVAREIQESDRFLGAVVGGQLDLIAGQIRRLQQEAQTILERARQSAELHRATCHFKKRPGAVYHLYRRSPTDAYLSMLSPEEWGGSPPHPFEGSYRLEVDLSFTRLDG
jgi:hypothetical protein